MDNADARRTWTGGAGGWLDNDALFERLFAPVTDALVDVVDPRPGDRLLEVGCGSGALLERAAAQGARVVGIDIAPGMVEAAGRRVPEATLLLGDAAALDLRAPLSGAGYDIVASRFGVMFFADPVAAFANLRRAADPDTGLLAFACWGAREENPMFTLGTDVLVRRIEAEIGTPEAGPAAMPGPTSLADPDLVRAILADAGWSSICLERIEFECDYGAGRTDGVEERLAVVLGTTTGRRAAEVLRPRLDDAAWAALLDEVRAEIRAARPDGVARHRASAWVVSAASRDGRGAVDAA